MRRNESALSTGHLAETSQIPVDQAISEIIDGIKRRDPGQVEFRQAVEEVAESLKPLFAKHPKYLRAFRVLIEPERIVHFRVIWEDDKGHVQCNRGYRVQFSSTLGPYKGGLRFHPSVTLSVIKFLGFEQILKNSLTNLSLGGAKGGSDFDPKGKSDAEVRRFCKEFMTCLFPYIGKDVDVPAGDIGVGGREVGFLHGQYKSSTNIHQGGEITGKGTAWGGSDIRPEATGYGVVYFTERALGDLGQELKGKRVLVSGSGNVAQYAVEKLLQKGALPLTMSDSNGYIVEPEGITSEQLMSLMSLKNVQRGRLSEWKGLSSKGKYVEGAKPWSVSGDVALPCATQNEIGMEDAKALVGGGVKTVGEGANMPTTSEAIAYLKSNGVLFLPAKAANAGGVAVSGLEMAQNSERLHWTPEQVDAELKKIMNSIYDSCAKAAQEYGTKGDIQLGANIAGFLRVANSMFDIGKVY